MGVTQRCMNSTGACHFPVLQPSDTFFEPRQPTDGGWPRCVALIRGRRADINVETCSS